MTQPEVDTYATYLKDIGATPLLTPEKEILIAHRIGRHLKRYRRSLFSAACVLQAAVDLLRAVRDGKAAAYNVVELPPAGAVGQQNVRWLLAEVAPHPSVVAEEPRGVYRGLRPAAAGHRETPSLAANRAAPSEGGAVARTTASEDAGTATGDSRAARDGQANANASSSARASGEGRQGCRRQEPAPELAAIMLRLEEDDVSLSAPVGLHQQTTPHS